MPHLCNKWIQNEPGGRLFKACRQLAKLARFGDTNRLKVVLHFPINLKIKIFILLLGSCQFCQWTIIFCYEKGRQSSVATLRTNYA